MAQFRRDLLTKCSAKEMANMKELTMCVLILTMIPKHMENRVVLTSGDKPSLTSEAPLKAGRVKIRCMRRQCESRKAVIKSSSSKGKTNRNRGADNNRPRSNSAGRSLS